MDFTLHRRKRQLNECPNLTSTEEKFSFRQLCEKGDVAAVLKRIKALNSSPSEIGNWMAVALRFRSPST